LRQHHHPLPHQRDSVVNFLLLGEEHQYVSGVFVCVNFHDRVDRGFNIVFGWFDKILHLDRIHGTLHT
jgi:hypothetical protein